MKMIVTTSKFLGLLAVLLLANLNARAQMPGGAGAEMSSSLLKLFGDITAFNAKADVRVLDASDKETARMPMDFSLLDKKIRLEIDLAQVKSSDMPPGAAASLRQMGMAHVISLFRPDKKRAYVVYPDQRIFLKIENSDFGETPSKSAKTPLGEATLDGHSCVKNKVVITGDKGQTVEAITWNATDLKDFPLQIQTKEAGKTSFVRFSQVRFEKSDAAEFEPPSNFTEYTDQMELIQAVMKKVTAGTK
jgi:hypothetical protein